MDTEYQNSEKESPLFDRLPEGPSKETVCLMRDELTREAGGKNWMLRQRLNGVVGTTAAALLANLIFWSGKGHAPGGWVWKTREEIMHPIDGTGQLNGEQQIARKILRGDRTWNKQTFNLVEECRPSRRRAVFYRVDFFAVAQAIGVELSESSLETTHDFLATDFDDWDDFGESESSLETTESSLEAPESSLGTPSVESFSRVGSVFSPLQGGDEPACAEPPPTPKGEEKEQKSSTPRSLIDKRHSREGLTPSETTAGEGKGETNLVETSPPKPSNPPLLNEVEEILDPNSGRWEDVRFIHKIPDHYTPKKTTTYLINNAEQDVKFPEHILTAERDELEECVGYVLWQMRRTDSEREAS